MRFLDNQNVREFAARSSATQEILIEAFQAEMINY